MTETEQQLSLPIDGLEPHEALAVWMRRRGFTQIKLAGELGIAQCNISDWIREGHIPKKHIERCEKILCARLRPEPANT